LGRLGPAARAALPALTELLSDPVPDVRCKAPGALVSIAGPETGVVLALIKALEGQDSAVRGESARALGRLGPAAQAAIPPLLEALRDPAVRWRAIKALSKIDPTRRAPVPLQIVGPNDADQSDRHATEMLTRMDPSAEGIAALITNLKHPRSGFRHRSAFILGEMGTNARPAIPALTEALKDPKSKVRRIAYAALRKLEVTQETEAKATLP
jgi:HEAT repeat protein